MTLNRVKIDLFFPIPSNSRELRWFVPITVILVFVFQGNDVHVSSMEFLECFVYSRLLIINKALASERSLAFSHFLDKSPVGCVEDFARVYAEQFAGVDERFHRH